jgi:site-specific DNA-methyltransferase (adenine-specific)/site-specific DNA-methyltransferase (cytosine-N4-specific)
MPVRSLNELSLNRQRTKYSILLGDSREVLKSIPDSSIDLIITSPPYSDQRKGTYGGIKADDYVDWFMPIAIELLRVLKPSGTFILNIKEKVVNGERSVYVLNLILEMRKIGWLWTEEFIWNKKNSYPGKWPNRFRDSWERLLQFNKSRKFYMDQEAVKVPVGDWAQSRLKKLSNTDMIRDNAKNNSGFGKNVSNWIGRDYVYPSNVLTMATECYNRNHSAAYPQELPLWFIKLFTHEKGMVLDPFMGSGTTIYAAERLGRSCIGIDLIPEYVEMTKKKLEDIGLLYNEIEGCYESIIN